MSDDLVKIGRDALKGVTEGPWQVSWYVCHANMEDVKYQKTRPLSRGEKRRNLKVGDELWKQATSIGPLFTDHDHWSGYHLSCSNEDALFIAASRDLVAQMTDRIEELEAKLEMAVELVGRAFNEGFIEGMNDVLRKGGGKSWHESRSRTTLAELKGGKDE